MSKVYIVQFRMPDGSIWSVCRDSIEEARTLAQEKANKYCWPVHILQDWETAETVEPAGVER